MDPSTSSRCQSAPVLLALGLGALLSTTPLSAEAPAETGVTVGFELLRNQIVLEVYLGDSGPYNMLLDTGVTPSGLDLALARETGLLQSDEPVGQAGGVGGEAIPIYAAEIRGLRLGGLSPDPFPAVALDTSFLGKRLGKPLHGTLGHAFLKSRRVRIDYPGRKVTFDGPVTEPKEGATLYRASLEFVKDDIMPLLTDLRVDGVVVPVSLDTGSSLVLELYPEGAKRAGIEPQAGESVTVTGARGDEETDKGRARRIELGPFVQTDQEVLLARQARPGANRQGNLGNGFLRHYVLTVDYVEGWVTIEAPGPSSQTP